jgi:hypothetical protein
MTTEGIAVSPRKIHFAFRGNIVALSIGVAVALIVGAPSAMAGTPVPARSGSAAREVGGGTGAMTDISAARRRHTARRSSPAAGAAYGNSIGGAIYGYPSDGGYPGLGYGGGYPGFGYGVHDNSGPRSSG